MRCRPRALGEATPHTQQFGRNAGRRGTPAEVALAPQPAVGSAPCAAAYRRRPGARRMLPAWIDRSIDAAVDLPWARIAGPAARYATLARTKDKTMNHTKRIAVMLLLATCAGAGLTGCNTVRGIGKDTERAGEKIQKEADRNQSSRDDAELRRATARS